MKKYVKPDLYFESFQLTQHIAACGYDMIDSMDVERCYSQGDIHGIYPNYGENLFIEGNEKCQGKVEFYCYTNGTDGMTDEMFKVLVS